MFPIRCAAAALMSGPIVTPKSRPLPICTNASRSSKADLNSSNLESWTMKRSGQTHVWPAFRNLAAMTASTATPTSASAQIINGALPPSSSPSFFTVCAHFEYNIFPTAVDPVNDKARTVVEAHSASPTWATWSLDAVTTLTTPGGKQSCARAARASAVSGVSSAGLMTTAQPAAKAGAILRVIIAAGKFQGVMHAATPTGDRSVSSCRSRPVPIFTEPWMRTASSAYHSTNDAAYSTSPLASASGLPHSSVMIRPSSSTFARMARCHFFSAAARLAAGACRHVSKPAAAAAMARSASAAVKSGTDASTTPEAGSSTSNF
mmetsp:Transcript_20254/g.68619  ORF Transcript_20254/g.68619 Transcript_20254/m.68619 type:complete len:320 (-) Transcript_20254:218-1177(-)